DLIGQFYYIPTKQWITFSDTPHEYTINPDIKHPYVKQFTVGVDRELPWGISFGGHYVQRSWHNIIEDVNVTGQWAPVTVTNPVTGQPITIYAQTNPGDNQFIMTNVNANTCFGCFTPDWRYHGLEFYGNKRVSNKMYLSTSFVWSEARGNYDNRNNA